MTDNPCGSAGKESASNMGDLGSIPGIHSSILAQRILCPWGGRVGHDQTINIETDKSDNLIYYIISFTNAVMIKINE